MSDGKNYWDILVDTTRGVFHEGLEQVSKELTHRRQIDLLKFQALMEQNDEVQAQGQGQPYISSGEWNNPNQLQGSAFNFSSLGNVSPLMLAMFFAGAVFLIKK